MSDSLPKLGSGNEIKIGWFILLRFLSLKRDIGSGEVRWVHVHIVCDSDIIGGCRDTRIIWSSRRYNFR